MKMLVIGIAGGTGSGKSTVARNIVSQLPNETVAIIDYDSYYKDRQDLSYDERCKLNYDHPDSLERQMWHHGKIVGTRVAARRRERAQIGRRADANARHCSRACPLRSALRTWTQT